MRKLVCLQGQSLREKLDLVDRANDDLSLVAEGSQHRRGSDKQQDGQDVGPGARSESASTSFSFFKSFLPVVSSEGRHRSMSHGFINMNLESRGEEPRLPNRTSAPACVPDPSLENTNTNETATVGRTRSIGQLLRHVSESFAMRGVDPRIL